MLTAIPASPPARARPRIGRKPVRRTHAGCPIASRRSTRIVRIHHGFASSPAPLRFPETGLLRGKTPPFLAAPPSSGGGIRTRDLRVMSPTSYQTAPPRSEKGKVKENPEGCQAQIPAKSPVQTPSPRHSFAGTRFDAGHAAPRKRKGGSVVVGRGRTYSRASAARASGSPSIPLAGPRPNARAMKG